jgi:hypothetical protein
MTELCTWEVTTSARKPQITVNAAGGIWHGPFFCGLALARRLEQPQPLADIRFGTLIALPLILDF